MKFILNHMSKIFKSPNSKSKKLNYIKIFKKKSFLLIEILVAISIISMLSVPLIRNPICFCKSQIKSLEKLECERIAELTFLDIKLKLISGERINISKYVKDAISNHLPSYKLDAFKNKEILRSYVVYSKREKQTEANDIYKFLNITIFLKPKGNKDKDVYKYKYKATYKVPNRVSLN